MEIRYYIIELQNRDDGITNQSTTQRSTKASALSYYYDRLGKMIATELYPSVCLCLIDNEGNTLMANKKIITQWKEPEPTPEPEPEPEGDGDGEEEPVENG